MLGRTIIGTARCMNGENPVPGSSGWKIQTGQTYRVLRLWLVDATEWVQILADDGTAGNYRADRFVIALKEDEHHGT